MGFTHVINLFKSIAVIITVSFFLQSTTLSADSQFSPLFDTGAYNSGIAQDQDGIIWCATSTGLVKYNGYEQIVYKKRKEAIDGISANLVGTVFVDSENLIWLGTYGGGLNKYNKETDSFTHYTHDAKDQTSVSSNNTTWSSHLITEDSDGYIWFGTTQGLNRFDKKTNEFKRYNTSHGLSDETIWSVLADSKDRIWVGTATGGLNLLEKSTNQFKSYNYIEEDTQSLGKGIVYTIFEDKKGIIWIGTSEGGLCKFNEQTETFESFRDSQTNTPNSKNSVYCIYEDMNENLWLSGYFDTAYGIVVFNKKNKEIIAHYKNTEQYSELPGNVIMSFHEDINGAVLILDNEGKVSLSNPYKLAFTTKDSGNFKLGQHYSCVSIFEDSKNCKWLSFVGGLGIIDKDNNYKSINLSEFKNTYIFSALEDSSGEYILASNDGSLNIFDKENNKILRRYKSKLVSKAAISMIEDKFAPGIFWFGTQGQGMVRFDKKMGTFKVYRQERQQHSSISYNFVIHIMQDDSGILWISTLEGGLNKFNPKTEEFTHYKHAANDHSTIGGNSVMCTYIDSSNRFWVGTEDGGLNLFDPDKETFKRFTMVNGFASKSIRAILEDSKGYLWLTSDSGLYQFDPKSEQVLWRLTKQDGLSVESFALFATATCKSEDGKLWIAGTKGIISFDPEKLKKKITSVPVVLTSLMQGGEKMEMSSATEKVTNLNLNWKSNYFEFEMAALNYTNRSKRQYKYKLEGWDTEWFYAGQKRFGRYTGLAGGDYTLRIVAEKSDGTWNEEGEIQLQVKVTPPIWQTAFFKITIAVLLIIIAITIFKYIRKLENEIRLREQAEKDLEDQRLDLQVTLDSIGDAVIATDSRGRVIRMNPKAEEMTGWLHNEVKDTDLDNVFMTQDTLGNHIYPFNAIMEGRLGCNNPVDSVLLNKNGQRYEIAESGSIIRNQKGEASGVVVVFRDMTDRNQIQAQLRHSQKMESLGQLAGGIAHDFNNMLSGILGLSELLQLKLQDNEKLSTYAHTISETAVRASELTGKLLSFSRKGKNLAKPIDMHKVIKDVMLILESCIDKRIKISHNFNAVNSTIEGDHSELHNAILNLGVNSRDAMPDGGLLAIHTETVILTSRSTPVIAGELHEGTFIKIDITDSGIGMSSDIISRIFEPFFSTKSSTKGTGLGLSAVYGTIKEHHGAVNVSSRPNEGTTFEIFLPVSTKSLINRAMKDTKPKKSTGNSILLVDDEQVILAFAKELLEFKGYTVTTAKDGEEALSIFKERQQEIDIVLLDMIMPHMNGEDCFYQMRKVDPEIKVVICSGYTNNSSLDQMHRDGLKGFLKKPYRGEEIFKLLEKISQE